MNYFTLFDGTLMAPKTVTAPYYTYSEIDANNKDIIN